MTAFDDIADLYDETRGGERRGDEYAADVDRHLPPGDGPILEIGVGTGVVALGLARRGRNVVGVDLSFPMLTRARDRLGPTVALSDALRMGIGTGVVAHAVSVWVVHAVSDPAALLREAARVLRRGGRYVICTTQRPVPDNAVGRIMEQAVARAAAVTGVAGPARPTTEWIVGLAEDAGFRAEVHTLERLWLSSRGDERAHLELRTWPGLSDLDEAHFALVAGPAGDALNALPEAAFARRATVDLLVLHRS
ncbi:MAG TPA: class I SAM-dependent methyltransferase [Acidimicrobiales bacterium]|nr:class I SAM-dependent methyltransferase [Acidimicrobiales bacterium]